MRLLLLLALATAVLAAPAVAQRQGSAGVSARIATSLRVVAPSTALAEAPASGASPGALALSVERGWTWSLAARVEDAAVDLDVRLCRAARCVARAEHGRAARAGGALLIEPRLRPGRPAPDGRGTLTYLVAPL